MDTETDRQMEITSQPGCEVLTPFFAAADNWARWEINIGLIWLIRLGCVGLGSGGAEFTSLGGTTPYLARSP